MGCSSVVEIDYTKCNSCSDCYDCCPSQVFEVNFLPMGGWIIVVENMESCTCCELCVEECRVFAIEV